jgi:hypothetical protein
MIIFGITESKYPCGEWFIDFFTDRLLCPISDQHRLEVDISTSNTNVCIFLKKISVCTRFFHSAHERIMHGCAMPVFIISQRFYRISMTFKIEVLQIKLKEFNFGSCRSLSYILCMKLK